MRIVFTDRARKDWRRLPYSAQNQIRDTLSFYIKSGNLLKFAEKLNNYAWGEYRFRIGDYRIVFDIHSDSIIVLRVGNQRDIYGA